LKLTNSIIKNAQNEKEIFDVFVEGAEGMMGAVVFTTFDGLKTHPFGSREKVPVKYPVAPV